MKSSIVEVAGLIPAPSAPGAATATTLRRTVMKAINTLGLAIAAMILVAAPAWAVDEHHQVQPGQAAQAPQAGQPAQPGAAAPQAPGMGMMGPGMMGPGMMGPGMMGPGMMSGMMGPGMMGGMMGGMGPGGDQVGPLDRVEGRIAFLRAEIKIGEPQTQAWTGFADALRANAKKLAELPRTPP